MGLLESIANSLLSNQSLIPGLKVLVIITIEYAEFELVLVSIFDARRICKRSGCLPHSTGVDKTKDFCLLSV